MNSRALGTALLILVASAVGALADERVDQLTDEHRRWLQEDVVYIITDREKEVFLTLGTAEERDRFIEAFWDRRDPNPATLENEFKTEHYRRIDYANKYLGREAPKPGWRTDRGRYYIILGKPLEIQRYDGLNDVVSMELWFYQGDTSLGLPPRFNLLFFKENDIGEYQLYHPHADGPEALLRAGFSYRVNQNLAVDALEIVSMDVARASLTIDLTEPVGSFLSGRNTRDPLLLQVRPSMGVDADLARIAESPMRRVDTDYLDGYLRYGDRVSADYSFRFVPNRKYFAVLVGPKSTPFVHYSIELDPENFSLEVNEDETRFYTTVDVSAEVRDLRGNLIVINDNTVFVELTPSQMEQVSAYPFAYQGSFPLVLPGSYKLNVTLRNRATKQFTVAEEEVHVPSFGAQPGLSDIIVGYRKELAGSAGEDEHLTFQIGNNRIHPATEHVFPIGETVQVLFQVVGADPECRLRFAILDGEETLQERETRLEDYRGGPVMEEFSLLGVMGGHYQLQAQLLDPDGAVAAERSVPLTVSPRSAIPRPGFVYRKGFNVGVPGLLALARGQQLLAFGRLEEAQVELEEAVAANNPNLPMARWKLAEALLYSREADRALELLLPLKDEHSGEYGVVEGLGYAFYFKKDFAQAVAYLEKAMTLRAPDPSLLNALGDSYQELGRNEDAKAVFERSLELNPAQKGVKQRLASLGAVSSN
ncbi:MAG: GWxTD domain-containing protein [Acidobacteriota bacterium]